MTFIDLDDLDYLDPRNFHFLNLDFVVIVTATLDIGSTMASFLLIVKSAYTTYSTRDWAFLHIMHNMHHLLLTINSKVFIVGFKKDSQQ